MPISSAAAASSCSLYSFCSVLALNVVTRVALFAFRSFNFYLAVNFTIALLLL